MSTFNPRNLFTDAEVKAIRRSFAEALDSFESLELKMCVDGTPFKVDRGMVNFSGLPPLRDTAWNSVPPT